MMHRETLHGQTIFVLHDFLTPAECTEAIARSEQTGYQEATISTGPSAVMIKEIRNNDRLIWDDPVLAARLFERARPLLPATWFDWELVGFNERFRYYRYDPGQRFAAHSDGYFQRENGERSHFTFLIYLNDDFEGGATRFAPSSGGQTIRPARGMVLVFQHQLVHEGMPVLKGRKYVLRTDVMYRRQS